MMTSAMHLSSDRSYVRTNRNASTMEIYLMNEEAKRYNSHDKQGKPATKYPLLCYRSTVQCLIATCIPLKLQNTDGVNFKFCELCHEVFLLD